MIGHGAGVSFATEFFNPPTPVTVPVHGFNPGQRLRVVLIPTGEDQFAINLRTPSDIAFHFNVRFGEHAVVRNSTQGGGWQQEERWQGEFPFHHGRIYSIEFVAHPGKIEVFINGRHFCEFPERHSHGAVSSIEVGAGVHVHSIHVVQ